MQCRRPRFNAWVGKIPWRREWQPTPVFLPREFHGQRSLAGYSPWGRKESGMIEQLTLSLRWIGGKMASAISCFQLFTAVLLRPNWLFCNRKDHFPMLVFHGEFTTEGLWWYVLLVTCEVYLSYCLPNIYSFFFFFPKYLFLTFYLKKVFLEDWNFWSIQ